MSVRVEFDGRLGNNLFQYAAGRIIAEQKGHAFHSPALPDFPDAVSYLPGKMETCCPYYTRSYGFQRLDIDKVIRHRGQVIVNAYHQRWEIYKDAQTAIRGWFEQPLDPTTAPHPDDLVIHARLGDYLFIDRNYLGFGYYWSLIERGGFRQVWLVTDTPHHPDVQQLAAMGVNIRCKSPLEDFLFLRQARQLAISQSSFSWWAAFLGQPAKLYFPITQQGVTRGFWYQEPGPDDPALLFDSPGLIVIPTF
jgi:hypothetical protein